MSKRALITGISGQDGASTAVPPVWAACNGRRNGVTSRLTPLPLNLGHQIHHRPDRAGRLCRRPEPALTRMIEEQFTA